MSTVRRLRLALSGAVACTLVATSAACTINPGAPTPTTHTGGGAPGTTSPEPSPTPRDVELTLLAAGDVLPHQPVNDSATGPSGVDFTPLLAGIDQWVDGADLALCHLEAPVAPPGTTPSGYPVFAAPRELISDLADQGWDGCSTASNHAADAGYDGIVATLDALDDEGMGHAGTARDQQESRRPQLYELHRDGRTVTVAHLSATYDLNGVDPPQGPWSVDLIEAKHLVGQAKAARAAGADLVLVSMHDGVEYTHEPTQQQRETAQALARSRQVDLVIGHHAHVPQPVERLRGGPGNDGMWVAYGLGNLLSNQGPDCCVLASAVGLLLVADIVQPPDGPARVTDARWAPTTVDIAAGHRLRTLRDALAHPGAGELTPAELTERLEIGRQAAGQDADEQRTPPDATEDRPPRVLPRTR